MYTRKVFRVRDMIKWTRYETLLFFVLGFVFVLLYHVMGFNYLRIPWTPLAVIGTAVAFVIGFQNNAAYGRIWEARKIWGGIVNTSRTFGMFLQDMVTNEHADQSVSDEEIKSEVKTLTYRHIAWMTALRHAMRQPRPWEIIKEEKTNREWRNIAHAPEESSTVEQDMAAYLSEEDLNYTMSKNNKQTALLYLQSRHLRKLKEQSLIWEFSFLELEQVLQEFFNLQGKSERIKNFPYPRHFATLNHYFMWIFVILLPLGLVPQFSDIGKTLLETGQACGSYFVWFAIPCYALVAWVFHTMERIGRTGENPFEGSANDVPISTIARGIEIDLRQNLGESPEEIPDQFPMIYDTQF